jgi:acetylornithine deacetylase/succinyl-diaminopimelate desuccinylase-like protein
VIEKQTKLIKKLVPEVQRTYASVKRSKKCRGSASHLVYKTVKEGCMNRTAFASILQEHFSLNLPDYLAALRQMVEINSFTAHAAGVNELGQVTATLFAQLGFKAEFVQSAIAHYGKHLVLTRNGRANQTIGLVSHLDTVFPAEEEQRNSFHWREEGDRIYGPGTVDIKGGTVLIYMMLDALRTHAPEQFEAINWVILVDASEEAEAEDFGQLCIDRLEGPDTLACLIFEGGSNRDDCSPRRVREGQIPIVVGVGVGEHAVAVGLDHVVDRERGQEASEPQRPLGRLRTEAPGARALPHFR